MRPTSRWTPPRTRAERLPARDDSLALPDDVAPAPARVDIAAAVAAAGLADGGGPRSGARRCVRPPAPAAIGRRAGAGAKAGAKAGGRRPSAPSLRQRRRFARERAVQALYQWHMTGASSSDVRREFLATQEMDRVDVEYFEAAFRGVTLAPDAVDGALGEVLDRDLTETTSRTARLSASAITGRLAASITSRRTTAALGSSAPRQRRGRNAAIAVSASTSEPMGRIGPCAE